MRDIFQKIGETLAEIEGSQNNFKVANGLWVFPEGKCPFCGQVIQSKKIWLLGEAKLLKMWSLVGPRRSKKLGRSRRSHPHIELSGDVCMGYLSGGGSNHSTEAALFLGMNAEGSFWGSRYKRWFRWLNTVWGHRCPSKQELMEYSSD